jgi:hypothetical protein
MAELPSIKRIVREDIKNAPDWIESLIGPLNSFMEEVYNALDRDLTIGQNLRGAIKSINFKTRSSYGTAPVADNWEVQKIANPMQVKPQLVVIGDITDKDTFLPITSNVSLSWDFLDGTIRINYVAGLQANKRYEIKLLIL